MDIQDIVEFLHSNEDGDVDMDEAATLKEDMENFIVSSYAMVQFIEDMGDDTVSNSSALVKSISANAKVIAKVKNKLFKAKVTRGRPRIRKVGR